MNKNFDKFYSLTIRSEKFLLPLTILLIAAANYMVFFYPPSERIMGAVQRIFYFHVASATACYVSFAVVFLASILYLSRKERCYDALNVAAAEVGFLFCTITLLSGMIWGKAAWNTWFRFEPRLVSFLLIWLIFLSFSILRNFADSSKTAAHSAILGIIGALTVPLMIYSIKLLPSSAQLHPQVVEKQGLHPLMMQTMLFCIFTFFVLQCLLLAYRLRIEILKNKLTYGNT